VVAAIMSTCKEQGFLNRMLKEKNKFGKLPLEMTKDNTFEPFSVNAMFVTMFVLSLFP